MQYTLIHNILARLLSAVMIAMAVALGSTSCIDQYDNGLRPLEEGEGRLSLTIPYTGDGGDPESVQSRSAYDPSSPDYKETEVNERKVNSLWFLAFPIEGSEGETVVSKLPCNQLDHADNYTIFNIILKYGTYHIYVIANVPGIDESFQWRGGEDRLKALVMNYTATKMPSAVESGDGLPMCYESTTDVVINAESEGKEVLADLEFVCAKVRYTIMFDNSDFSAANFGTNGVKINGLWAENVASGAMVLSSQAKTKASTDPFGIFRISQEQAASLPGFIGKYNDADKTYDATNPDAAIFNSTDCANAGTWAYRGVVYVPEHLITKADENKQTNLKIGASLLATDGTERSKLAYTLPLGDTEGQDAVAAGDRARQIPRGRQYEITAKIVSLGDQLDVTTAVEDWTLMTVDAELNGPYSLFVTKTKIESLESGEQALVGCITDVPVLTYESPKYTLDDGTEVDMYVVEFVKDETTGEYTGFNVIINPRVPPVVGSGVTLPDYVYIVAGNLKKRIDITPTLKPYLIVTPAEVTVHIAEVGNVETHEVKFIYRTNLKNITITPDKSDRYVVDGEDKLTESYNPTVTNGEGTLTCTLKQPYLVENFSYTSTTTYTYTATGYSQTLTATTDLTIIPTATKYRLHFRPVADNWDNPHIYVYEPLFTPRGSKILLKDATTPGENAVLYGFTGMRTFKGWTSQGGEIANPWGSNITDDNENNNYEVERSGWDPSYGTQYVYNTSIDYCPDFREGCCVSAVNPKWPGVKMKEDTENPGWYYFDLPLLAKPGKALIMFANGHSGPPTSDESGTYRFPAHMVPGVPLYNYDDKDGWFLYDVDKGNANEFVDDKPEQDTYRIWVNNADAESVTGIYLWNGSTKYVGEFTSTTNNLLSDGTNKYIEFKAYSPLTGTMNYILRKGSGQSGDKSFTGWTTVTGKTYKYEATVDAAYY